MISPSMCTAKIRHKGYSVNQQTTQDPAAGNLIYWWRWTSKNNYTNNSITTIDHNEGNVQEVVGTQAKGTSPTQKKVTLLKPWALHVPSVRNSCTKSAAKEGKMIPATANAVNVDFEALQAH